MFVRAVWRCKRPAEAKRAWREMNAPETREAGPLGLCGPDFIRLTHGLFDR